MKLSRQGSCFNIVRASISGPQSKFESVGSVSYSASNYSFFGMLIAGSIRQWCVRFSIKRYQVCLERLVKERMTVFFWQ